MAKRNGSFSKGSRGGSPKLLSAVSDVFAEMLAILEVRTTPKDGENCLIRRVVKDQKRPLLISGFGLPDPYRPTQSRVLILIEEIGLREEVVARQAKELFHLTEREVAVVQHLLKGWTNKEIAFVLKLTEQTIKEHIQRIMAKTKSSSRTGILLRLLCL